MVVQIAVLGDDTDGNIKSLRKKNLELAQELGRELARKNIVILCGGRGGIMEAVAKGASEENGITIGILPGESKDEANRYIHITIPTGLGFIVRGIIIVRAADAVITIGGGVGTLAEMTAAYVHKKPIIGIEGTGGWTDRLIGKYIDERRLVKILGASCPKEAVKLALREIHRNDESVFSN